MDLNFFHQNQGQQLEVAYTGQPVDVQEVEILIHFLVREGAEHENHIQSVANRFYFPITESKNKNNHQMEIH